MGCSLNSRQEKDEKEQLPQGGGRVWGAKCKCESRISSGQELEGKHDPETQTPKENPKKY